MDSVEAQQQRYAEKIRTCGSIDPYSVQVSPMEIPTNISFAEIYHFMVVETNPFTGCPKDCRKGMEANLWFQQGWVKNVSGKLINDVFIVRGKVLHSFNLRKTPLKPWIIVAKTGKILSAHCDCTIGLLETCSHVGATLFALDDIRRKIAEKKISVTDLLAYWKKPPVVPEENLYKKVRDISFGRKIRRFWEEAAGTSNDKVVQLLSSLQDEGLNVAAMSSFCGTEGYQCASCEQCLKIEEDFNEYFLENLFDAPLRSAAAAERSRVVNLTASSMQSDPETLMRIEKLTVEQSESSTWKKFRIGRITASVLKDVIRTNMCNPSKSLIKRICYDNLGNFQTVATRYGKVNESKAFDKLFQSVAHLHVNARKEPSGFIISEQNPCLGASPDGIIYCDCHGKINVEIKCPYVGSCVQPEVFEETLLKMRDSFLILNDSNEICLNVKHKYYYQALMQVHIANACFGYFYVWSQSKHIVFLVRKNDAFWEACRAKAVTFFNEVILPELLYKAYTEPL